MLRGPDNTYYVGDGSTYTYGVVSGLEDDDSTVDPAKTITGPLHQCTGVSLTVSRKDLKHTLHGRCGKSII